MDWTLVYIVAAILILPSFIYGSICQSNVYSTFETYAKVASKSGLTAAELTDKLLKQAGINDVEIAQINGKLTDCYDSKHKVIKLSNSTCTSTSVASLGVCAHEVGHAIQDHQKSFLFRFRIFIAPILNFASFAFIPLIFIGSILGFMFHIPVVGYWIIWASVIMYGGSAFFSFITLPLEFDASKKALKMLEETGVMNSEELSQTKKVLKAAARTYIASFLTTLLYFLRFLSYALIVSGKRK